jgi:tetratricopeptide (TPR) repeat protein
LIEAGVVIMNGQGHIAFAASYFACLVLLGEVPTQAQPDEEKVQSKEHFILGVELFDEGMFSKALDEFRKSYDLYPHWKILRNIGMCYHSLGEDLHAAATLEEFLEKGGSDIDDATESEVMTILDGLKSKLGVFRLTGSCTGIELGVDGEKHPGGSEGKNIYVKPGLHHIMVTKDEKTVIDKNIMIEAGEEKEVFVTPYAFAEDKKPEETIELPEEEKKDIEGLGPAGEPSEAEGMEVEKTRIRKAGWAFLAVASAALVTGSVMGGLVIRENNLMKDAEAEYKEKLQTATVEELALIKERRDDLYDRGISFSIASTILFAVGGAAAFVSLILLPISFKKNGGEKKAAYSLAFGVQSLSLKLTF